MRNLRKAVVGIDSGGSKTRAVAVSFEGDLLARAETGGGHPYHNVRFRENIREALQRCLDQSEGFEVVRVVAGIAGLDKESDQVWAQESTEIPGFQATRVHVNDAEIAHFGALSGKPGILTVQGNGSMILAKLDDGRTLRNMDFHHYACAGGQWLGARGLFGIVGGSSTSEDEPFVEVVLRFWDAANVQELLLLASRGWDLPGEEARRRIGEMAPVVTQGAEAGSPLAISVCQWSATQVAEGISMLGHLFRSERVNVVLTGGAIRSPYMANALTRILKSRPEKRYEIVEPCFEPVIGAVLMALQQESQDLSVSERLPKS